MTHKQLLRHITITGTLLATLSCATDLLPTSQGGGGSGPLTLWADIKQLAVTRVDDEGFADGDQMGVYVVDYEGDQPGTLRPYENRANNVCHTYDEATGKWMPASPIYWKDKRTHVDIYGYYPLGGPTSVTAYPFTVQADQDRETDMDDMGGYEASDFLWGKVTDMAPTTTSIRLTLAHRMACARVTLAMGEGFTPQEWAELEKQVQLVNLVRKASIDLSTGTVTPTGKVEKTATRPQHNGNEWRAIVVPQTLAAGTTLVDITLDGQTYHFSRPEDFTFQAGRMNNFTIRVDRKFPTGDCTLTLLGESITPWESDPMSHDGTARKYIVVNSTTENFWDSIRALGINPNDIVHLKITGSMTNLDRIMLCDEYMPNLRTLNMREVINTDKAFSVGSSKMLRQLIISENFEWFESGGVAGCPHLRGPIPIPEGVWCIGMDAFHGTNLSGTLNLPSTLTKIEDRAFAACGYEDELRIPKGVTYIGEEAFAWCEKLTGNLALPKGLTYLGKYAFKESKRLTGDLVIPPSIKTIPDECFYGCSGLRGTLALHDGIVHIGSNAFAHSGLRGDVALPRHLDGHSKGAFAHTQFSHIIFPEGTFSALDNICEGCTNLTGPLVLPESMEEIGESAFAGCTSITSIKMRRNMSYIGPDAFAGCTGIKSIVCEAPTPPTLEGEPFKDVPKDSLTLEVPEAAVADYQVAPGWREFKFIAAHRELSCTPGLVCALNARQEQTITLKAEGAWKVESQPTWCSISQTSGSGNATLTLTIDPLAQAAEDRKGKVVFTLTDKDYVCEVLLTQRDYRHECDQRITLQKATEGNNGGINILLLGDGYDARDIARETYLDVMREQMERFFSIEPYSTYSQYFNVYTAIALSQESGIGTANFKQDTRFGTTYAGTGGLTVNSGEVFAYAERILPAGTDLSRTLIILVPNTREYSGNTQLWSDGSAIALCPPTEDVYPYDALGVIQHEACGHAFGKLGDEYSYNSGFIPSSALSELEAGKQRGWYDNLSTTGKQHEVSWRQLMLDSKYNGLTDIYEGGFGYAQGVYRPELNSCMNDNAPYFNAVSRMSIVRRIKEYAGEEFDYEDFKARDVLDVSTGTRSDRAFQAGGAHRQVPVIHQGSPLAGARRAHTGNTHRQRTQR